MNTERELILAYAELERIQSALFNLDMFELRKANEAVNRAIQKRARVSRRRTAKLVEQRELRARIAKLEAQR